MKKKRKNISEECLVLNQGDLYLTSHCLDDGEWVVFDYNTLKKSVFTEEDLILLDDSEKPKTPRMPLRLKMAIKDWVQGVGESLGDLDSYLVAYVSCIKTNCTKEECTCHFFKQFKSACMDTVAVPRYSRIPGPVWSHVLSYFESDEFAQQDFEAFAMNPKAEEMVAIVQARFPKLPRESLLTCYTRLRGNKEITLWDRVDKFLEGLGLERRGSKVYPKEAELFGPSEETSPKSQYVSSGMSAFMNVMGYTPGDSKEIAWLKSQIDDLRSRQDQLDTQLRYMQHTLGITYNPIVNAFKANPDL